MRVRIHAFKRKRSRELQAKMTSCISASARLTGRVVSVNARSNLVQSPLATMNILISSSTHLRHHDITSTS